MYIAKETITLLSSVPGLFLFVYTGLLVLVFRVSVPVREGAALRGVLKLLSCVSSDRR